MPFSARSTIAVLLLAAMSAGRVALAQTWHEGFESSQPTWHEAGGDVQFRILRHERIQRDAHTGNGCEWLQLEADRGTRIFIAHDVGRPPIIDELAPTLWVKSDRPGLQLAARIVLPRTTDPRTGQPVATIIAGSSYTEVGHWQQLNLTEIPRLLTRQVHVLRVQLGPRVDDREAYLDAVLVNLYSGPGTSNVWIDDLDVAGHVTVGRGLPSSPNDSTVSTNFRNSSDMLRQAPLTPVRLPPVAPMMRPPLTSVRLPPVVPIARPPRHEVKLVLGVLTVDGHPMLPRVVQYRGEPLEVLKRLRFNTVWLQRFPSPELLEQADRLDLWLICPPPRPVPTGAPSGDCPNFRVSENGTVPFGAGAPAVVADIGREFDCVLAWDLGDGLTGADLDATQHWADLVRAADRRVNRPLICRPRTNLRGFSRAANVLLIDRRPLGTSLELDKWATWVRQQPLLASLGTPVWTTVQTQPNEAMCRQLTAMEPGYVPPLSVSPDQIRLLAYTAVASGSRGLVFASDTPLDAADPDTRQRAMALELINFDLELLEPWAAAKTYFISADSNVKEVSGALLVAPRARLLLPLWLSPGAQCVPSQLPTKASNPLTLVAPGVPEASNAYELTPQGAQPLRHERIAGGMSVTLDECGLTSQILLAHDPLIISAVHRRSEQNGRRAAELWRNLIVHKFATVQSLSGRLAQRTPVPSAATWLAAARKSLELCDAQLAVGNAAGAVLNAQRADRSLQLVERAYWDAAVKGLVGAPVTSPAAMSFDTLPCHWRFFDRLAASRLGPNRIGGGDFEDWGTMTLAGWRYTLNPSPTVNTTIDLARPAARTGRFGVRLSVAPADPKNPPTVVETPPIFFTSPSVQVEAGQIVCIHGWVSVPTDITASTDGLLIVDSLSGEALADRIGKTNGWRQFAMYRAATQSGPMCVTFALSGIGEAWLDDVAIQVLEPASATAQR